MRNLTRKELQEVESHCEKIVEIWNTLEISSDRTWKQAGLSRATLKISSEFSSVISFTIPLRTLCQPWHHICTMSIRLESYLINSGWNIQALLILICSPSLSLKFEEDQITGCWDIQILMFWGHLLLEAIFISSIFNFDLVHWA